MKLRSLLLTAALFVSATIASAAVVHDSTNNTYAWERDTAVSDSVNVRLSTPTAEKWHYYLYSMNGPEWEVELKKGVQTVDLQGSTKVGVRAYQSNGGGHSEGKVCYSGVNTPTNPSSFLFIGNVANNEIVFGKNGNVKGIVSFGSPLPAPVVTLLIALGFGAALVMYRNRKQAKA